MLSEPVSNEIVMSNLKAWCSNMKNTSLSELRMRTVLQLLCIETVSVFYLFENNDVISGLLTAVPSSDARR